MTVSPLQDGKDLDIGLRLGGEGVFHPFEVLVEQGVDPPGFRFFSSLDDRLRAAGALEGTLQFFVVASPEPFEVFFLPGQAGLDLFAEFLPAGQHPLGPGKDSVMEELPEFIGRAGCAGVRQGLLPQAGALEKIFEFFDPDDLPAGKDHAEPPVDQGVALPVGDQSGEEIHRLAPGQDLRKGNDRSLVSGEGREHLVVHPFHGRMERPQIVDRRPRFFRHPASEYFPFHFLR